MMQEAVALDYPTADVGVYLQPQLRAWPITASSVSPSLPENAAESGACATSTGQRGVGSRRGWLLLPSLRRVGRPRLQP
jgi:hypothetical protein